MIVDTSAIFAILLGEDDAERYSMAMETAETLAISAVTMLEAGIVAEARRGERGGAELDMFIAAARMTIVPFDEEQAVLARRAFSRYGKGRHPANLNFGDCAAYTLAASRGEPLLFKSEDFSHTDIEPATAL